MPGIHNNYDHSDCEGFKMEELDFDRNNFKRSKVIAGTRRFRYGDLICGICGQKMKVEEDRCNYRLMHCTYCDDYKIQIGEEQII
nr:MAG TPA: LysW biosynthesis protein LysW [Caudoviricetes sp.]